MANRNDPLGYDMKCGLDIDPNGRSASGSELVIDSMLHRLTTDLLPLVDSPLGYIEFGEDVRKWLGASIADEELAARAAGLGPILERDERVAEATVTATRSTSPGALARFTLDITATLRTGETITRTVSVSSVTVEFLVQGR